MSTFKSGDIITDLDINEYHKPVHGLSSSVLKQFIGDPSSVVWARNAPQDSSKMAELAFGDDFHCKVLEPARFKSKYDTLPKVNRRTNAGKAEEAEAIAEFEKNGVTPISFEDDEKLTAMSQSISVHPVWKSLLELDWSPEVSMFWDDELGGRCKVRTDFFAELTDKNRPSFIPDDYDSVTVDIKTIQDLGQTQNQIGRLHYHVQQAFYERGIQAVTGKKTFFMFFFVSKKIELGRYPVMPLRLSEPAMYDAAFLVDKYLPMLADANKEDSNFTLVPEMDLPRWAQLDQDNY